MSTWDRTTKYYRGNGVLMMAVRDALGQPTGLEPVGNVTALGLSSEVTKIEHKESQSGQSAIDKTIETEKKMGISITFENFTPDIQAKLWRGSLTRSAAGSVTGETLKGYAGKVTPFAKAKTSAVAVKRGATTLTVYTNDATPFDYKVNFDAGSIWINDGSVAAVDKITTGGTAPSAITVGATTTVTVANTAVAGDKVVFTGFSGADAALINGKFHHIVSATSTEVVIDLNTTGKTITVGTPLSFFDGGALAVDYSYAAQTQMDAFTTGQQQYFLRFEGLNTAENNESVVVEFFKVEFSPPTEKGYITEGENLAQFPVEGNVLADPLRTSGSQFYREIQLGVS